MVAYVTSTTEVNHRVVGSTPTVGLYIFGSKSYEEPSTWLQRRPLINAAGSAVHLPRWVDRNKGLCISIVADSGKGQIQYARIGHEMQHPAVRYLLTCARRVNIFPTYGKEATSDKL